MRTPFTQLYLHCVWSTWDRLPLLTPQSEPPIYSAILNKCLELKCDALAIGGIEDHIHLLVRFPATISVSDFVKEVKGTSSHLINHQINPGEFFKWQGAYGAFTVSKNLVEVVQKYINLQKQHHADQNLYHEWEQTFFNE